MPVRPSKAVQKDEETYQMRQKGGTMSAYNIERQRPAQTSRNFDVSTTDSDTIDLCDASKTEITKNDGELAEIWGRQSKNSKTAPDDVAPGQGPQTTIEHPQSEAERLSAVQV